MPSHTLPFQLTSFIGRELALAEIELLLGSARLLTLTGAGGVGKTRLALELAHRALERFRGGVWLVDLAPLANASLVASVAASAIGLPEDPSAPVLERLTAYLGERTSLLLLDNCEHLVGACAALAEHLLRSCARLHMLATSREALNVPGEVVWPVPPLALPGQELTAAEEALASEGVRLFAERTRAVSPRFAVDDGSLPAVLAICRQLDGMPLALELAAAWMRVLSPEELAGRLDDRFKLLTSGSRTGDPRHRTLRALVDWSHDLLSERARILFRRLSVFAGGWTLQASEAICVGGEIEPGEVMPLLVQLVDKSLVTVASGSGETRYGLLETLRQYAAEKLEQAGEALVLRTRHLVWFRGFAEEREPLLQGPEQARLSSRLERELGNVRAALEWSKAEPSGLEEGLRLSGGLMRFWYYRGHVVEAQQWLSTILALADAVARGKRDVSRSWQAARATALLALGFQAARLAQDATATPLLAEALELWRTLGDKARVSYCLRELGLMARLANQFDHANALLDESLFLAREVGSRPLIYEALWVRGEVAQGLHENKRAQALYEESLALAREQQDARRIAAILNLLARLTLEEGSPATACAYLRESLIVTQSAGLRVGLAPALELLAWGAVMESQPSRALRLAAAAESVEAGIGAAEHQYVKFHASTVPWLELACQSLGAEAAGAAAEGRTMALEQAIAYALSDVDPPAATRGEVGTLSELLSSRELEVVALVTRGLTNREIAAELVISQGTAKRHVENILGKLGLSSRRELRAWEAEHAAAADSRSNVVPFKRKPAADLTPSQDHFTLRGG